MDLRIVDISVEIRPSNRHGALKAYADVQLRTKEGFLQEKGYAVIQKEGSSPFVGPPSRPGNVQGKYFPIVELEGDIRKAVFEAILAAYGKFDKW
jgi:hypothetical protein